MNMRWIGAILIAIVLFTSAACIGGIVLIGITQADATGADHVAVIDVYGSITARPSSGLFAVESANAEQIVEQLREIRENDAAVAILLNIDSPGSTVLAAEQIHAELVEIKQDGIPIVAYFGSMATSGAYYISAPADSIVANPATITGSIGVITQVPNLEELYEKIGIDMQTITTGEFKDMMQPSRPLTDEEIDIIQTIQNESYEAFIDAISDGRDMSESDVRELADGRVYTGRQSIENGLVDELGDFQDASAIAGELSGLGSDPNLRNYTPGPPGFWDLVTGVTVGGVEIDLPSIFGPSIDPRDVYLEFRMSLQ
jgi:protease IV